VTWQEILELVKRKPREEAFAFIDRLVAQRPDLATAGNKVKAFLDQFYALAALDVSVQAATDEILLLIRDGMGPVSDSPEIGLV
jgi:hypothetical protein